MMRRAALRNEPGHFITADEYALRQEKPAVQCCDLDKVGCCGPVTFVPRRQSHGSFVSEAGFAATNREKHSELCRDRYPRFQQEHNSVSVGKALNKRLPIILNLNFPIGHPDYLSFDPRTIESLDTRYNRFRGRFVHGSKSIKSLSQYFSQRASLLKRTTDHEIYPAHAQDLRRMESFELSSEEDLRAHFQAMAGDGYQKEIEGVRIGFPRILMGFVPTQKQITERHNNSLLVRGNEVLVESRGDHHLHCLQVLKFSTQRLRQQFMEHMPHDVIATPRLDREQLEAARAALARRRNVYIGMEWTVENSGQFRLSDNAISIPEQLALEEI